MKKLLVAVTVIVLALVLVGFWLPADYRIERRRVLAAGPERVRAQVRDLESWPQWTAWSRAEDPECVWTFDDPDAFGVPRAMHWSGPKHGEGTIELTELADPDRIEFALTGVDGDTVLRSVGAFAFEGDARGGTEVVWSLSGVMAANPVHRWIGLFMDSLVGADLERGLEGLEEEVLGRPNPR
ncbi:Polyketide cyclase / dehydrase and lipid transport [Planctomycetes bacterium Pla163]|uniref:Polyketide cyclase / dehydrase and lipid transport n=1 Tax=Rohdeia mirabilis TaxID=2528008 RepID=A0A518CX44_9BACT|nr:Polyketide cyclase / dehydrase and lipid transport [Planctomycetes bacterium Pla163]